jgi:hypothetical protein
VSFAEVIEGLASSRHASTAIAMAMAGSAARRHRC